MKKNDKQKSGEAIQISGNDFPPFSSFYYNSNIVKIYDIKEKGGESLPEIWIVSPDFCLSFFVN